MAVVDALLPSSSEAASHANLAAPTPISASGPDYVVNKVESPLNVRSAPKIVRTDIIAKLPDGHPAKSVDDEVVNGFREIQTSLFGALIQGVLCRRVSAAIGFDRANPGSRGMRPCGFVVLHPFGNGVSDMIDPEEQALVQELVAHPAVEALDVAILHRRRGRHAQQTHPDRPTR